MLVLSRRQNEKIVFPSLGITVHVVRVAGKTVRLGVQAPRDVPVVRHELAEQWNQWREYPAAGPAKSIGHRLRNRLNVATLGLNLLHRQLEIGALQDVESTIFQIFRELDLIEKEISQLKDPGTAGQLTKAKRALLVEDNEFEAELLAGYLRTCNFEVVTARDGADALEYLAYNQKPDVVLLDMAMPRVDGPTAICEIRSDPQNAGVKLFGLSGMSQSQAGVITGPMGVDGWFTKPIKPDLLVSQLNRELHLA